METHTEDLRMLRGLGRMMLTDGQDQSKVVFDLCHLASRGGISEATVGEAVADLKREGLIVLEPREGRDG